MAGTYITLEGMPELQAKLNALEQAARGPTIKAAVVSGALLITNAAKRNAHIITGSLRRSIHIGGETDMTPDFSPSEDSTAYGAEYSDIGIAEATATEVAVQLGTNLSYAPSQEVMTAFLSSAWDANIEAAQNEVTEALNIILNRMSK